MLLIASSIFLAVGAHAKRHEQRNRGRPSCSEAGHARLCRRGSAARSALRRANAHSRRPSRPSSCARRRLSHVRLADRPGNHLADQRAPHAAGVGSCEIKHARRSRRRRPGCGAGRRAANRSANWSRVLPSSPVNRARARRSASCQTCPSASARRCPVACTPPWPTGARLVLPRSAPAVARTRQRLGKFRLQHRLDEAR